MNLLSIYLWMVNIYLSMKNHLMSIIEPVICDISMVQVIDNKLFFTSINLKFILHVVSMCTMYTNICTCVNNYFVKIYFRNTIYSFIVNGSLNDIRLMLKFVKEFDVVHNMHLERVGTIAFKHNDDSIEINNNALDNYFKLCLLCVATRLDLKPFLKLEHVLMSVTKHDVDSYVITKNTFPFNKVTGVLSECQIETLYITDDDIE